MTMTKIITLLTALLISGAPAYAAEVTPFVPPSPGGTPAMLDQAVGLYAHTKTYPSWLKELGKAHVSAKDMAFLRGEAHRFAFMPLPHATREQSALVIQTREAPIALQFIDLNRGEITVNHTDIVLKGLDARESWRRIAESLPSAHGYAWVPGIQEAHADTLDPLDALGDRTLMSAVPGIYILYRWVQAAWGDRVIKAGLSFCDKIRKDPSTSWTDRTKLQVISAVEALRRLMTDHMSDCRAAPLLMCEPSHQLDVCLSDLAARAQNELTPPHTQAPQSGAEPGR